MVFTRKRAAPVRRPERTKVKTKTYQNKRYESVTLYLPEASDVANLKVGDVVPSCFGLSEVTEIFARGTDVHGADFVCFYVKSGSGTMSVGMKAGELVRSFAACRDFNSNDLDQLEYALRAEAGIVDGKCRRETHWAVALPSAPSVDRWIGGAR